MRKPWYKQKRVIFTLGLLAVLVASFFTTEDQTMKIINIVGMVVASLGFIFQEAWTDKDFKDAINPFDLLGGSDNEDEDNEGNE